jgi:hypothetical protein
VTRFQAVQRAYEHLAAFWARDRDDRRRVTKEARKRGGGGGGSGGGGASTTQKQRQQSTSERTAQQPQNPTPTKNANYAVAASTAAAPPAAAAATAADAVIPSCDLKQLGDDALAAGDFARAVECYDAALAYARTDGQGWAIFPSRYFAVKTRFN